MVIKCKICESETSLIHHLKFGDYYWCKKCEFISKDEKFILSPEEEHKVYNNHNNSIEDPKYVEFFYQFLDDAVFKYIDDGREGFDFGSGPSPVLAQILERYHDYKMDIYDQFYAKKKPFIGKKYDLVTSTEVVEHLANPIPYFRLFVNLMKDDAILAVMTLFHPNNEEDFLDWYYIRDYTHISFYTPNTFKTIAEKIGLKVIYTNNRRYITLVKDKDFKLKDRNIQ